MAIKLVVIIWFDYFLAYSSLQQNCSACGDTLEFCYNDDREHLENQEGLDQSSRRWSVPRKDSFRERLRLFSRNVGAIKDDPEHHRETWKWPASNNALGPFISRQVVLHEQKSEVQNLIADHKDCHRGFWGSTCQQTSELWPWSSTLLCCKLPAPSIQRQSSEVGNWRELLQGHRCLHQERAYRRRQWSARLLFTGKYKLFLKLNYQ